VQHRYPCTVNLNKQISSGKLCALTLPVHEQDTLQASHLHVPFPSEGKKGFWMWETRKGGGWCHSPSRRAVRHESGRRPRMRPRREQRPAGPSLSGPTLLTSWTVATASWRPPVGRRRDRAYPQRISGRHVSTVAPRKQPANRRRDLDPSRLEAPGPSGLLCVWVQVQRCPSVRPGQPIWLAHGSNPRLFLRLSLSVVFTKRCFGR
jgi:hypothetical protein